VSQTRALMLWLLLAAIPGCTVGPHYQRPDTAVPQQWVHADQPGLSAGVVAVLQWWQTLKDPLLDALIERAVHANLDLRIAQARVREARALRGVAAADQFPTVTVSSAYARNRLSENVTTTPKSIAPEYDLFQSGFDASWELDLFGRVRRTVEAASADLAATEDNRRDVLVTLLAEVARNYVDVRGFQRRLDITRDNIRTQQQTVELTTTRFAAGLSSELDVAQARANLATTEAQVPVLESSLTQAMHRLSVLLGQPPGALLGELAQVQPIPLGPESVPIGLPADLLRRRPDVRRTEQELAAATARIGVATADLFPRFSLLGTLDLRSNDIGSLFSAGSLAWAVGPRVIWPLFDAGRIRANIAVQTARQETALTRYEQAGLVAFAQERLRYRSLAEAVAANRHAVDLSMELYTRGLGDFLSVLESQRSLFGSEDQLVQSERAVVANLISVYKALGGGWEGWLPIEQGQTGPRHGFHQCGIKLTGSNTASPYILTHDLYMPETAFCLYAALLLVELMLTTASRLNSAPAERMLWPCLSRLHVAPSLRRAHNERSPGPPPSQPQQPDAAGCHPCGARALRGKAVGEG
jgi:outer membrane protein, multidrug efflux system